MGQRDRDGADGAALESADVDEASGLVAFGITEHAAGARLAGLRGAAARGQFVHAATDGGGIVGRRRTQDGGEDDGTVQLGAIAVEGVETVATRGAHAALRRQPLDGFDDVEDPAAHRAGVHAQGPADGAGDALEEFEAGAAGARGHAAQFLEAGAAADAEAAFAEVGHGAPAGGVEMQDQAVVTFVRHEQVGTASEHEPAEVEFGGRAQERDEVVDRRGFGIPAGRATEAQRGATGERLVGAEDAVRGKTAGDEIGQVRRKNAFAAAAQHLGVGLGVALDVARAHEGHHRVGALGERVEQGRQRATVVDEAVRRTGDDRIGTAPFDGGLAGGIDREHERPIGHGERVAELARILARPGVAMRLEDDQQAAGVRLAHPLQQRGDLRRMMRVVGEHAQAGAFEKDVLPATDAAPARQRFGDEAAGDEVRDRERQRGVRAVEGARDREIELARGETSAERDHRRGMPALHEPAGIITIFAHADDRHLEAGDEALKARVADGDHDGGTGTFEKRPEDGFERGFVAVVIGVIPVEVHRHGDVGRERADRAVALIDLRDDPRRGRRGARRRERRVAEEAAEHVAEIGARAGERGDEQAAGGGLTVAAADGDETAFGDRFGEKFAAPQGAHAMAFGERERGVAWLHRAGAADDGRTTARGPGIAQKRHFAVGELELHRAAGRVVPAGDFPAVAFQVKRERADAHAARPEHPDRTAHAGAPPARATVSVARASQRLAASASASASRMAASAASS